MKVLIRRVAMAGVFATALSAGGAWAHHSYAMFDHEKPTTMMGTVAKVEWSNPHVYFWLYGDKKNDKGQYDLFAFEGGSVNMLMRRGWTSTTLKVGEKVAIDYYPLRDGRPGGSFIQATHADGKISRDSGGGGGPNQGPPAGGRPGGPPGAPPPGGPQ